MCKQVLLIFSLLAACMNCGFAQQSEMNEQMKEMLKEITKSIETLSESNSPLSSPLARIMIEALQKYRAGLSPEEQIKLDAVSADLMKKPDEVMYRLSWSTDICASKLLDCYGLANDKIKPVIAGMLEYKKRAEAAAQERRSLWTSLGGSRDQLLLASAEYFGLL